MGPSDPSGDTFTNNDFFFLTAIHVVHLLTGFVALGILIYQLSSRKRDQEIVETCATYWHTVDFFRVLIFALRYVVRCRIASSSGAHRRIVRRARRTQKRASSTL